MPVNIKFDISGNPELPTLILANRNGDKLGILDARDVVLKDSFNDISEISFTLNKLIDGKLSNLWYEVTNFKLVYCKEWDLWFDINVSINESLHTEKKVSCVQLGQSELSQINLYNIEINTENDIARTNYIPTILYNPETPSASLLNRILQKAPNYSIEYVAPSIANIQRTFSFDNISIYDAFLKISEEIKCLFVFNSNSDSEGNIKRTISVYDLLQSCTKCGYRGDFEDTCPKCSHTTIKNGYGNDTTIFITSEELADTIQLSPNTDEVKNCFKLEAGDDLMTATIRNCNPNGTDYIWNITDSTKKNMSNELSIKLNEYDNLYQNYYSEYIINIDGSLINSYNKLVDKYSIYNQDLQLLPSSIKGYSSLMNAYYNTIDLKSYLESSLMPSPIMSDTTAIEQAKLLTSSAISPVAVSKLNSLSLSTANNAVLSIAKILVNSKYSVKVNTSQLNKESNIWTGNFIITNYYNEEDTANSDTIAVLINDNLEMFIQQKLDKSFNNSNTDDLSISELFNQSYENFCTELKKYSLIHLSSINNACQACIDILIEQGVANKETWENSLSNLYNELYIPYYEKLKAIESEIAIRENEISIISNVQKNIDDFRDTIQEKLNFEKYLGIDLWKELSSFRREDKYSNSNYISDGLNNTELFEKALQFIDVAKAEIYKSSELQHSISGSLRNLLSIPKFKLLIKHFCVGNWLRLQVDDRIFKLRLLDYQIDYSNFDKIPITFSDVCNAKNCITDIQSVLSQASSIASSYDYVQRQAEQGSRGNTVVNAWFENGLDVTNTKIVGGANNQTQVWDEHGMLFRQYDPLNDRYDDTQLKIINSTLAITTTNWLTTKVAIGNFYYIDPITGETKNTYGVNGETIVGKLLLGETLGIYNSSGTLTFDKNGLNVTNNINTITINPNADSVFSIKNKTNEVFYTDSNGNLTMTGILYSSAGKIGGWDIGNGYLRYKDKNNLYCGVGILGTSKAFYAGATSENGSDGKFQVDHTGKIIASDAEIQGKITATSGSIGGWAISNTRIVSAMDALLTSRPNTFSIINETSMPWLQATDSSGAVTFSLSRDGDLTVNNGIFNNSTISGTVNLIDATSQQDSNDLKFKITGTDEYNNVSYLKMYSDTLSFDYNYASSSTKYRSGISPFGLTVGGINYFTIDVYSKLICKLPSEFTSKLTADIYTAKTGFSVPSTTYGISFDSASHIWSNVGQHLYFGASNESDYYVELGVEDNTWGWIPVSDNKITLGTGNHRWNQLFSATATISTSDINYKKNIHPISDVYEEILLQSTPVTFQFIDGTSSRTHTGYKAQELEELLIKHGLTTMDWAAVCKDLKSDGKYIYGLRYEEFIPIIGKIQQRHNKEINELQYKLQEVVSQINNLCNINITI